MGQKEQMQRTEQLKDYLTRLVEGEELESVRADFVKHFQNVEASEIMKAEQELLSEGIPLAEVQKLCDVHSALFHGVIHEEIHGADYSNKKEQAGKLTGIPGHPLHTFTKENEVLKVLLQKAGQEIREGRDCSEELKRIQGIAIHYAKKGDLLYPHLKVKYGISGPSEVMWTVDDEIRDELSSLLKESGQTQMWQLRVEAVLKRMEEMIYKEANILFPMCAVNFTKEEWKGIYRDSKDYAACFGVEAEIWQEAEDTEALESSMGEGEVILPGGRMTLEQLTALLNTIPMEITFIDEEDVNRYFNEGHKVFKRPAMALGREVFSCHPPKIEPMVRGIIADFRSGRRDSVPVWMEKEGKTMLVNYMAVRDKDRNYLGTVELVQDMEFAKKHFIK